MPFMNKSDKMHQVQLMLENEMFNGGITRFQANEDRAISQGAGSETSPNRRLIKELIKPMAEGIESWKEYYNGKRGQPAKALRYIRCLPAETCAYIALKTTLDMMMLDVSLTSIATDIGARIEDQIRFTKLEGSAEKYFKKVQDGLKKNNTKSYAHKHAVMVAAEKRIVENDKEGKAERWLPFPPCDLGHIGYQLLDIMEQTLVFKDEPVFSRAMMVSNGKRVHKLQVSTSIAEWSHEYSGVLAELSPAFMPCVVPPRDWVSPFNGGFHTQEVASRLQLVKGKRKFVKTLTREKMPLVYEGINFLQSVPWAVNKEVLDVATEIMKKDLGYAMPRFNKLIDRKQSPIPCPVPTEFQHLRGAELKMCLSENEWKDFLHWKSETAKLYTAETKRGSRASSVVRLIGQARKYSEYDTFYFVYAMDSRQRVYVQSSVLNPQGNDISKSMLRSAVGFPIKSEKGYKHFCITGANLYGWDKDHLDTKFDKVDNEDFIEMCHDIAADPLTFRDWVGADEPWEFLAWALEFSKYHELKEEGKEEEFLTYLPNGRDGSCSGIQHYSAMMHDEVGGAAVNLVPSDSHQDIYRRVAERVIEKMNKVISGELTVDFKERKLEDGSKEQPIPHVLQVELSKAWLTIGVTRGMCKKPVMTLPYGSSQTTCRESIDEYLVDLEEEEAKNAYNEGRKANPVHPFGDSSSMMPEHKAISFATKLVWESIGEIVKAPVVAMKFIKKLCRKVSKLNKHLEWTTPTGFTVYQEIFATEENEVYTKLMGMTRFYLLEETDTIDVTSMCSAAAPNFVHSFDASHLLLSVVAMKRAGFKFVHVIHDDFGTDADNTEGLGNILRVEMKNMYKEFNRLNEYMLENEARCEEDFELEVPPQYGLDLDLIEDSLFSFA